MKRMSCGLLFASLAWGIVISGYGQVQLRPPTPTVVVPAVPPPAALQPPPVLPNGNQPTPLDQFLAFDAGQKDANVTNGTPAAEFTFNLTNISAGDVIINFVQTSCGCTVAKLPSTPWKIASKEHGEISATMQLGGVPPGGTKMKTLTLNTDKGIRVLYVKATVVAAVMSEMDRTNAQQLAIADRQAVFKGDCARCHVEPAKDVAGRQKMGPDLYTAVCGICHDAEHRASFVPDLHHLKEPTNPDFWKNWIMHGKPGTLMPAFAAAEGGILSDQQITSLVEYLTVTIPSNPTAATPPTNLQVK